MEFQIYDSHRLMYKNAQIRAFDLSNRTTPLNFYNVTQERPEGVDVGTMLYTNENGYLCYGTNRQGVVCATVKKSAIIQVSLDGGTSWRIEWVSKVDDKVIHTNEITKLFYADGTLAFDPISGNATLRDFVQRSELADGQWVEEQLQITENSTQTNPFYVSVWTSTIVLQAGGPVSEVWLNVADMRYGQKINIYNGHSNNVTVAFYDYRTGISSSAIIVPGSNYVGFAYKTGNGVGILGVDAVDVLNVQTIAENAAARAVAPLVPPNFAFQKARFEAQDSTTFVNSANYVWVNEAAQLNYFYTGPVKVTQHLKTQAGGHGVCHIYIVARGGLNDNKERTVFVSVVGCVEELDVVDTEVIFHVGQMTGNEFKESVSFSRMSKIMQGTGDDFAVRFVYFGTVPYMTAELLNANSGLVEHKG